MAAERPRAGAWLTCGARTPRRPPGDRRASSPFRVGVGRRSDVLVELECLLVVLFGELEPHEQAGEHDQRDDEQRAERDAQGDGDGLECLHGWFLLAGQAGESLALEPRRGAGALAIRSAMSSRVNSTSSCLRPPCPAVVRRMT